MLCLRLQAVVMVMLSWELATGAHQTPVADPEGGGVRGFNPPPSEVFLLLVACQYMKISPDLDPNPPPPSKNSGPEPPPPP